MDEFFEYVVVRDTKMTLFQFRRLHNVILYQMTVINKLPIWHRAIYEAFFIGSISISLKLPDFFIMMLIHRMYYRTNHLARDIILNQFLYFIDDVVRIEVEQL